MSYDDDNARAHKTGRIAIFAFLAFLLAVFFFCYKVNACADKPATCKDEFFEVKSDTNNEHACSPGATVEVVNSPPAPKPGIICHCPGHNSAPSASAAQ